MLKKIKCLIKGHQFMMHYYAGQNLCYPMFSDQCKCCKKQRGVTK